GDLNNNFVTRVNNERTLFFGSIPSAQLRNAGGDLNNNFVTRVNNERTLFFGSIPSAQLRNVVGALITISVPLVING
ncbi:MAG: hypothetical protein J7L77_03920, partial [Clostridiales bacterium]|nr:hypothetical protein [Clostridiales bacterium]